MTSVAYTSQTPQPGQFVPAANHADAIYIQDPRAIHVSSNGKRGARVASFDASYIVNASWSKGELIDLTGDDNAQPPTKRRRMTFDTSSSPQFDAVVNAPRDMDAIFNDLRRAAQTSFELLDPLSILQEWFSQGPTPSKQYHDAALATLSALLPDVKRSFVKSALQQRLYLLTTFLYLKGCIHNQTAPPKPKICVRRKRPLAPSQLTTSNLRQIANPGGLETANLNQELRAIESLYSELPGKTVTGLDRALDPQNQVECGCCTDECDISEAITCTGDTIHFFCRGCVKQYVEVSLLGTGKAHAACFGNDSCDGVIPDAQLTLCVDRSSMTRLERIQQQNDLREAFPAGPDEFISLNQFNSRLESCPECDYQAWTTVNDKLTDFNCQNPACGRISCRSCRKKSHGPLPCAQARSSCTLEHAVAEALSDRLVRTCGKCSNRFVKETDGNYCNKMCCSVCGTVSCFICGAMGISYSHFDDKRHGGRVGACPLWGLPPVDLVAVQAKVREKMGEADANFGDSFADVIKSQIAKLERA